MRCGVKLDQWELKQLEYLNELFASGDFTAFCNEYCHDGLRIEPLDSGGHRVAVCSDELIVGSLSEVESGVKTLAERLVDLANNRGELGC